MSIAAFSLIFGVYCYLFGLPMLFAEREAVAWRKKLLKDDVSLRLLGGAAVVVCALALKTKWFVTQDAEGIVVVLAWLGLLKGLLITWWPAHFAQMVQWEEKQFDGPFWQMLFGLAAIMVGAFLTYLGLVLRTV